MPISVQCDQCGKTLKVPDTAAGKRGKCPCGAVLVIPAAGGFQTAPSAPARAPAAAPRKSQARPAVSHEDDYGGGGGGSVTPPATFKKLFMGYILCLILTVVAGILFAIIMTVFVGSAASSAGKGMEQYQDALIKHRTAVDLWENSGKLGPRPQEPLPPDLGSSVGGGLAIFFIGYGAIMIISLVGAVCLMMLIYKGWGLIQDGHPSTSPLMAILLLFVPLFQIYWFFVAYWGLAKDLNTYAREKDIDARPAAEGMMLWGIILVLLGCTAPIGGILLLLGFNSIKNTCMDIAAAKLAA